MNPNLWQSQAHMFSVPHGSLGVGAWVIQFETISLKNKLGPCVKFAVHQARDRYASHCICALQRHSLTGNTCKVLPVLCCLTMVTFCPERTLRLANGDLLLSNLFR